MKKSGRFWTAMAMIGCLLVGTSVFTSCKSSDNMYKSNRKTSKTIKKNYKVRGNNQRNSSTYHSY
ncbi:MAG: hypothetical protein K5864_07820 [Bacteroidales bacterium]|nr:hypothetical protein [Bacteroidales bacterium]